ncbi:hypothetical protein FACS1894102_4820 [Spirochaetia bacterium]|nr:hypothetical protein FACS1894102_4820 [Spirochaetia bacterium]
MKKTMFSRKIGVKTSIWQLIGMCALPAIAMLVTACPGSGETGPVGVGSISGPQVHFYNVNGVFSKQAVKKTTVTRGVGEDAETVQVYLMPEFQDKPAPGNIKRAGFILKGWSKEKQSSGDPGNGVKAQLIQTPVAAVVDENNDVITPAIEADELEGLDEDHPIYKVYAYWEKDPDIFTTPPVISNNQFQYEQDYAISTGDGLNATLKAAIDLLTSKQKGTTKTEEVEVEGFDEEGNPLTEEITYKEFDIDAIIAAKVALETLLEDPAMLANLSASDGLPTEVSISSKAPANAKNTSAAALEAGYREQTLLVHKPGVYEFDVYGASGGHIFSKSGASTTGGKGAHVKHELTIAAADTVVTIKVGQEGWGSAIFTDVTEETIDLPEDQQVKGPKRLIKKTVYTDEGALPSWSILSSVTYGTGHRGGWPNGGTGGPSWDGYSGGNGGGGSTDIIINGVREIVAGGGGGSAQSSWLQPDDIWPGLDGGDADANGYYRGGLPTNATLIENGGTYLKKGINGRYYGVVPAYTSSTYEYNQGAAFDASPIPGKGANGVGGGAAEGTGAGGGGYVGGAARSSYTAGTSSSGAGGTSYPRASRTDSTADLGLNPIYGDGHVTVKYLRAN